MPNSMLQLVTYHGSLFLSRVFIIINFVCCARKSLAIIIIICHNMKGSLIINPS